MSLGYAKKIFELKSKNTFLRLSLKFEIRGFLQLLPSFSFAKRSIAPPFVPFWNGICLSSLMLLSNSLLEIEWMDFQVFFKLHNALKHMRIAKLCYANDQYKFQMFFLIFLKCLATLEVLIWRWFLPWDLNRDTYNRGYHWWMTDDSLFR